MLTGKLARHCSECRTAAARWTVHHKSARDMERSIVRQEQTWAWRGSPGPQRAPARKPAGPSQPAGPVRKVLVCL